MLVSFTPEQLEQAGRSALSDELEMGRIPFFATAPFPLPAPEDLDFLRSELPKHLDRKNVSYYPSADRLIGVQGNAELARRAQAILKSHSAHVQAFLRARMPDFTQAWTVGTSSFRPLQEQGRALSAHASNELVHVDAGAYGATHGGRVLRFFVNVHPSEDRVWATRGTFPELLARYGAAAGVLTTRHAPDLSERPWDRARTGLVRALAGIGVGRASVLDGSPYDRAMRRFHNFMKDDPTFRTGRDGYEQMSFPAGSAWAVLTDMVSHACLSGQHALVDTFVIPLERCRLPQLSPFHVLQRAAATPSPALK